MSQTEQLLPPSSSSQERALAAVSSRFDDLPVIYRQLWNADTCPVSFLPYLAWSFSVDEWSDYWSETVKRKTIRDSLYQHRIKGSRQSIDTAIAAFNAQVALIEWWEQNPTATPHTFQVWLNAAQNDQVAPVLALVGIDAEVYCSTAIPVITSRVYRVSFKVRQTAGSAVISAGVATLDSEYNVLDTSRFCAVDNSTIGTNDGWQTFTGEITGTGSDKQQFSPNTVLVRPVFSITGNSGTAQIAELTCTDLFENQQLVPNPNFQHNKTGWSTDTGGETVSDNAPGTITSVSFGLTANLQNSIMAAINAVKPLRSKFTVQTGVASAGALNMVGVARGLNFRRLELTA